MTEKINRILDHDIQKAQHAKLNSEIEMQQNNIIIHTVINIEENQV